jgi:cold shock CspA family protein
LDDGLRYAIGRQAPSFAENLVSSIQKNSDHLHPSGLWAAFRDHYSESVPAVSTVKFGKLSTEPGNVEVKSSEVNLRPVEKQQVSTRRIGTGTGRIIRLLLGFGFLEDSDGKEWYFHRNSFSPANRWTQLKRGQEVTFELGKNQRGPCAVKVRLLQ